MKPLISGAEAKRYITPIRDTYLLFPYSVSENGVRLIDKATMEERYPKAWAYLKSYEDVLRMREAQRDQEGAVVEAPFDDKQWYRFGRHQNLDKQEIVKLIVAQTVPEMRVCVDESSSMYLNNVRVNGIIPSLEEDPWYLLGVLNSKTADFVFRRIAKVKDGGFFEANRQFIAPLPIPRASASDRTEVARRARALQATHTARRDVLLKIQRRLSATRRRNRPETWLFPGLKTKHELMAAAPSALDTENKQKWAELRYALDLAAYHGAITVRLRSGASLSASFVDGELSFAIDGVPIIGRVFVTATEGEFILAQWKIVAATFVITPSIDGKKLADALRKLTVGDNPALVEQIITLESEFSVLDREIMRQEAEMNALVNRLYGLSDADRLLVEKGRETHQKSERIPVPPAAAPKIGTRLTRGSRSRARF
jgi:hypothetical protein